MWDAATSLRVEHVAKNPPARGRGDWVYAAIVVAAVALEAVLRRDLVWRPVAVAFGCGLAVAVLFRRTHPLLAVAFAFGTFAALDVATFVAGAEPMVLHSGWVVLVLAYSLFRWRAGRDAAIGLAVMAVAVSASVSTDFTGVAEAIAGTAVLLCAAALGVSVRYRGKRSLRCARWSAHSGTARSSQPWSPNAALPTSNVWPRTAPTRFASTWNCAVN